MYCLISLLFQICFDKSFIILVKIIKNKNLQANIKCTKGSGEKSEMWKCWLHPVAQNPPERFPLFEIISTLSCMSEISAVVTLCVTSMTMTDACRVNSFDASLSCFCYSALTLKAAKLGRVISEPALLCILACIFMSIYESEAIKLCFVFNRWG